MKRFIYAAAALFAFTAVASAQSLECSFENNDCDGVSTYDTWAESPFMTGKLAGQAMLVDNPYVDEMNSTARVLAFHRSRHGSHLYGARVMLDAPVAFTAQPRYLHVMIRKPADGDAALVILGKRSDRAEQSPNTVQLVTRSINTLKGGEWSDAVFEVRGNALAEMHSLVIAPDTERNPASHDSYTAYIDNLLLNDDPQPRNVSEPYRLSFPADMAVQGRAIPFAGISVSGDKGAEGLMMLDSLSDNAYIDMTSFAPLPAVPGEKLSFAFAGADECGGCEIYADWDNDGLFDVAKSEALPQTGGELVAMSSRLAQGGATDAENPGFVVPADLNPGIYRVRCKLYGHKTYEPHVSDPYDVDVEAGGRIVDLLLNVHGSKVKAGFVARMCEIALPDGSAVPSEVEFGKDFTFRINMDGDYRLTGLEIKHGYNLGGAEFANANRQWKTEIMQLSSDGLVTIPAEMIDGDISVTILFVNK